MSIKAAIILAVGLALGGLLSGGFYEFKMSAGDRAIFKMNTFTGNITLCAMTDVAGC